MNLKNIDFLSSYHKWLENCNFFQCFLRTGPFVSLKHFNDFTLEEPNLCADDIYKKIVSLINNVNIRETLLIIDLPSSISIKQGFLLNNLMKIKPVLVFNFLVHNYGLIGGNTFVNELIMFGENLKTIMPEGYAFILDYDRFNDFTEKELAEGFNNQYELSDENLPSIDMLKELNYKKILYLFPSKIKEDISNYLKYLEEDFKIEMISIDEVKING